MALTSDGKLYSWGAGYEGTRPVLGHGNSDREVVPRLVQALKDQTIVHIACGWDHSMCINCSGQLFTWGANTSGMLGLNHTSPEQTPQLVDGFDKAKVVWADGGQDHSVVITDKGELWSMGSGGPQLGLGDSEMKKIPTRIGSTVGKQIFGTVSCGDKCAFPISSTLPRTVLSRPPSHGALADRMPLPPYPICSYVIGSADSFLTKGEVLRDFSRERNLDVRLVGGGSIVCQQPQTGELPHLRLAKGQSITIPFVDSENGNVSFGMFVAPSKPSCRLLKLIDEDCNSVSIRVNDELVLEVCEGTTDEPFDFEENSDIAQLQREELMKPHLVVVSVGCPKEVPTKPMGSPTTSDTSTVGTEPHTFTVYW
eukprot:12982_1